LDCSAFRCGDGLTRIEKIEAAIGELGSAIVAFSGGVDSSVVACLAARALGSRALAVTAVSPALATGELNGAAALARAIGISHEIVRTDELRRPEYVANGRDRCYHCKTELYDRLLLLAEDRRFASVLSGANADDVGDWRPGLAAASEHGIRHPLLEAGVDKLEVRAIARELHVPSADKPAMPCLASRIPYGTPVDPATLAQVDRAEARVKRLGYRIVRVRHYGPLGKVQIGLGELARALEPRNRSEIVAAVRAAGYERVEVDEEPFRSGSLNTTFVGSIAPIRRS
jgi:uncharacterized protein